MVSRRLGLHIFYWLANIFLAVQRLLTRMGIFTDSQALVVGAQNGIWIDIAKMLGQLCNFNCCIILVAVVISSLTWLKDTRLGQLLPINEAGEYHKFLGFFAFFLGSAHG